MLCSLRSTNGLLQCFPQEHVGRDIFFLRGAPAPQQYIHSSRYPYQCYLWYKGSAPRAADAARYARERQGTIPLKTCKGGRKKRPMIWCEQQFDNAKSCLCRANCPVVLSCAVCFCYRCCVLIGSTGVICLGEKTWGRERSNTCRKRKKKKSSTQQHVRIIPVTALMLEESTQRSTTQQHRSEGHGTAPHGSARRYAALLGYI